MANLVDWSHIKSQVSQFKKSLMLERDEDAFTFFCLDLFTKLDHQDISDLITDGSMDRGIDAIFIEESDVGNCIYLYQFKHVSNFDKSTNNFPSNEVDKIVSFISDLLSKSEDMLETCNPLLSRHITNIWDALEQKVFDFKVVLCSNSGKLSDVYRDSFERKIAKYKYFSVDEYGLEELSSLVVDKGRPQTTSQIHLLDEQLFERSDGFVRGIIGSTRADEFVDMIRSEESDSQINDSLFEDNIRVYLGEKNDVNQKIYNSAISESSFEFWYLNNGITIVCDSFDYQPQSRTPMVKISNPQIVNGGQTSHALFQAAHRDFDKLSNVKVLVKIIETKDSKFRQRIAEATNSQTPIRSRDLRSTDQIQIKIESALENYGYFYERKRNQHQDKPKGQRMDALKAGQVLLAYYHEEPDKAKTQSDKIFGEYYELLFNDEETTVEKLLSAYRLYEEIEHRKDIAKQKMRSKVSREYGEQWIIEGAFHVLFVVHLLCGRDNIVSDEFEEASTKIDEAISLVSDYVQKQKGVSAYRLFRSSITKERLKAFSPAQQMELNLL